MSTIATWNVNSVRSRLDLILRLVHEHHIDILCLQEVQLSPDDFPHDFFHNLGFKHQKLAAAKGEGGVATLSRVKIMEDFSLDFAHKNDQRHLAVKINKNLEIHNFYVPAGGYKADPATEPKFKHKLQYLDDMIKWFSDNRDKSNGMVILGDLNVAPLPNDVWSHTELKNAVSHSHYEVNRFQKLMETCNWIDVPRLEVEASEKLFSWWSYRTVDWQSKNYGRRLDHILVTGKIKPLIKKVEFIKKTRSWYRPSDHIPIIIHLENF